MRLKNGSRNGISLELKSKILAESIMAGAVISSVAKKYNISKGTIYHWMKQNASTTNAHQPNENQPNENQQFVELAILDPVAYIEPEIAPSSTLESATLAWKDLKISFDGKILSSHLLEIIKILDGKSC